MNSGAAFRNTGNGAGVNSGQYQNWGFRITALLAAPSGAIVINVASGSQTQAQAGYAEIAVADSVTKTGAGTLVLDVANGYSGPTRIDTGRLALAASGAVAASPLVTVAAGATFDVSS